MTFCTTQLTLALDLTLIHDDFLKVGNPSTTTTTTTSTTTTSSTNTDTTTKLPLQQAYQLYHWGAALGPSTIAHVTLLEPLSLSSLSGGSSSGNNSGNSNSNSSSGVHSIDNGTVLLGWSNSGQNVYGILVETVRRGDSQLQIQYRHIGGEVEPVEEDVEEEEEFPIGVFTGSSSDNNHKVSTYYCHGGSYPHANVRGCK
jgi:hypothetical protein